MANNTAPLYRRTFVDGYEVRATKAAAPMHARYYPVVAAYPVEFAGVLRGYLARQRPGHFDHSHKGWVLLSLLPQSIEREGLTRVATAYEGLTNGIDGRDRLLSQVPALVASGSLPTAAEVAVKMEERQAAAERAAVAAAEARAEAERQRIEREAAAERRRAEDAAERERRAAERSELAGALRDMLDRLGPMGQRHLTNYEADALARAAVLIAGASEAR
jgi:hypothetical protein